MKTKHKFEGPDAIEKANAFARKRVKLGLEMLSFTTAADGTVNVVLQGEERKDG